MPKDSSSGVSRYSWSSTASGMNPFLSSMTRRRPCSPSVRSVTSAMPVIFLALYSSRIFSITFSGPTIYGSSVITSPVRRAVICSTSAVARIWKRAAAGVVGVADAVQAHDPAAGGQVRAGDEPHEVVDGRVRVGDQVPGGGDHLDEVVRGHVRGHADGDARGAVDQQVREGGRQHVRLQLAAVVVGHEVDDVLVEAGDHRAAPRRPAGTRCSAGPPGRRRGSRSCRARRSAAAAARTDCAIRTSAS